MPLQTINTLAVLSMLLTQDRCTKNYLLYLDLKTSKWQMFAYDLKSALNADAGYGGKQSPELEEKIRGMALTGRGFPVGGRLRVKGGGNAGRGDGEGLHR